MPTIRPFFSPETLKSLAPARLRALLAPFKESLAECRIRVGRGDQEPALERLAALLAKGDERLPGDLLTAFSVVDELANPAGMDALLAEAKDAGICLELRSDDTPADIAAACWVQERRVAERVHATQAFRRQRSFVSFQTDRRGPRIRLPKPAVLAALERELGPDFAARRRGCGCRVQAYDRADGLWFLVRHGAPMRREECWEGGQVCFRPVQYDVLVYDRLVGELRINAHTQGERLLYRRLFGKHLFGSEAFFPGEEKYTLAPLIQEGADALDPSGIPGIDGVALSAVQIFWGGTKHGVESYRADDVFSFVAERGTDLPLDRRWTMATFKIKLAGTSRPRGVTVRPTNIASYARDETSDLVERWLERSGFILSKDVAKHAHAQ